MDFKTSPTPSGSTPPKPTKETPKVQPSVEVPEAITIGDQTISIGSSSIPSSGGSTQDQIIKGIEKAVRKGVFPKPPQIEEMPK